jgi:2-iminobutanoate/2-iminopropanoate deaminase
MPNPKRAWVPAPLPKGFPPPVGPYTPAVRAGNLVFISGQTPRDPVTGEVGNPDVQVQARRTLHNLKHVVEAAGATLDDIVSVTVYLANEEHWGAFNEVYKEFFTEPYPTRTAVGCSLRGILVEVSAIALVGGGGGAAAPAPAAPSGGTGKGFRPDMTLY